MYYKIIYIYIYIYIYMYILGITYKRNHENNITHRISLITLR